MAVAGEKGTKYREMKRIGEKKTSKYIEYKMRSLSMLFTSKITNDSDFDAIDVAKKIASLPARWIYVNLIVPSSNERETQTSFQIMCIFVEHNISVFLLHHATKTSIF